MCVLNCFKAMNVEYTDDNLAIYRTSRAFSILGSLFTLAGVVILIKLLIPGSCASSLFGLCIFCLFVALGFILAGILLISFHKIVKVDKNNSRIEISESSITGYCRNTIDFSDISGLEISKDSENLFGEASGLWIVRVYVSKIGKDGLRHFRKVEKIFATDRLDEARIVADYFARIENVDIVKSYPEDGNLVFVHQ
ncbi:MAG: hypothetical protein J6Z11_00660 [Candidatus Riflebacteria bacterium]|nr:hypothetical protein [Candidatus Riflebacteria bacterium]